MPRVNWWGRGLVAIALTLGLLAEHGVAAGAEGMPSTRYVRSTGHTLSGPFLQFVEIMGEDLLGAPISEPMLLDGTTVQWFERGRLDLRSNGGVVLGPVGTMLAPFNPSALYGSDANDQVPHAVGEAALMIDAFYREHGGEAIFGVPLGPLEGNSQWFERARLDYDPETQRVSLGPIGAEAMAQVGIDTEQAQVQWVAASEPVALYDAPTVRAPARVLEAERAVVLSGGAPGWLQVWDLFSDRRGWVREGLVGPVEQPQWAQQLDGVTPIVTRGRITTWQGGYKFNAQVELVARGTAEDGSVWYVTRGGDLLPSDVVRIPRPPARYYPGKWIDADLQIPVLLTAYEDDRPVYVALAVKGRPGNPTPVGKFQILRRVANERMNSATWGRPGLYDITGVLFTQYFTNDGAALHYNYWRSNWGGYGSFGCLGMNYDDSKFFWDWASVGTPVISHN